MILKNIEKYIKKYGDPDAIIDPWGNNKKKYMIWGFSSSCTFSNNSFFSNNIKLDGDPLFLLNKTIENWSQDSPLPVNAIGYISYDFKNTLYPHLQLDCIKSSAPLIWFAKPKIIIEFDCEDLSIYFNNEFEIELVSDIPDQNKYIDDISKIKTYLKDGDVYQINYTHPKTYNIIGDPLSLYSSLRTISEPLNGYYINTGHNHILSLSPESFFSIKNNIIETRPIKGTRSRNTDYKLDEVVIDELYNCPKDRAEHLMIVDLLRNDLGKICKYDTINVKDLFNVESFKTIYHMVTKIKGILRDEIDISDIISALFPGGSITGAPKERAIEIIDSLEPNNRNIYTGTIGHVSSNKEMYFNIAIRTLIINNSIGKYFVGGGIVWDSDPILEWEEANIKSNILTNLILKVD